MSPLSHSEAPVAAPACTPLETPAHVRWGKPFVDDTKPQFQRKRRKDGSLRKARVFGKPWWYEKAGWHEKQTNARRNAMLERLRQRWPDLRIPNEDASSDQELEDWIKPLIATFDDSAWCLPDISDHDTRFEEQLTIYTAWAKCIARESCAKVVDRNTPDQRTTSTSPPLTTALSKTQMSRSNSQHVSGNMSQMSPLPNVQDKLSHRWNQTRAINGTPSEQIKSTASPSEMDTLAGVWNFSAHGNRPDGRTPGKPLPLNDTPARSKSFTASSKVDNDSVVIGRDDISDSVTETTEISESELSQRAVEGSEVMARNLTDHASGGHEQYWNDSDWDDVVVQVDARKLDGENYPIPMTMLKPGSNRDMCRWDDFELDHFYSRFEIEAGYPVDRTKYVISHRANGKSTVINTPGKYKLMLKDFSRRFRRGAMSTLHLRIESKNASAARFNQSPWRRKQPHSKTHVGKVIQRSQFTGAASDFSTESESEDLAPLLKRQKSNTTQDRFTPSLSGHIAAAYTTSSSDRSALKHPTASKLVIDETAEKLKMREPSPEEYTQVTE